MNNTKELSSSMPFEKSKAYTIHDAQQQSVIELNSIKPIENWFQAKIQSRRLSNDLEQQFQEIELCIKERDFKSVQKIEAQILAQKLIIKELGRNLREIQMGKKDLIYFKI